MSEKWGREERSRIGDGDSVHGGLGCRHKRAGEGMNTCKSGDRVYRVPNPYCILRCTG
jgi:hypothetical protein